MRFLGIDYGGKRVGIAVSNEGNTIAFPKEVIPNTNDLIPRIKKLATENDIGTIVLGESKNFKGEDNVIMKSILTFKEKIENELKIPVLFEPEFLTSAQASQNSDNDMLDASAAALILQSFLDKKNSR